MLQLIGAEIPGPGYCNFLPMNRNRFLPLLWVIVFLTTVALLRYLDVHHGHFDSNGYIYVADNILKIFLFPQFFVLFIGAGSATLMLISVPVNRIDPNSIDELLLLSIIGILSLNILIFILFCLKLFYSIYFIIISVTCIYFGANELNLHNYVLPRIKPLFDSKLLNIFVYCCGLYLFILFITTLIHIFITMGIVPNWGTNDIPGTYIPVIDTLNLNHGYWPHRWFIHFFTAKGRGLQFFFGGLSDPFISQLGHLAIFFLALAVLGRLLWLATKNILLSIFAILCFLNFEGFLTYEVYIDSFVKSHIVICSFYIYLLFICSLLIAGDKKYYNQSMACLYIFIVSSTIFLPISFFITSLFIILAFILGQQLFSFPKIYKLLLPLSLGLMTLCTIYFYNYTKTGVFDFLVSGLDKYANFERFNNWHSTLAFKLQRFYNKNEGALTLYHFNEGKPFFTQLGHSLKLIRAVAWPIIIYIIFLADPFIKRITGAKTRDPNLSRMGYFPVMLSALFFFTILFMSIFCKHTAFARATLFREAYLTLAIFGGLGLTTIALTSSFKLEQKIITWFTVFFIVWSSAFYSYAFPWPTIPRITAGHVDYLLGRYSHLAWLDRSYSIMPEWQASRLLPRGTRVIQLTFNPGAIVLPDVEYLRWLKTPLRSDLGTLLYDSPEEAVKVLGRHGVNYVIVSFRFKKKLSYYALAPLFAPDEIGRHFRLLWQDPNTSTYLFVLSKDAGVPIPREVLETLREHIEQRDLFPFHAEIYTYGKKINDLLETKNR